MAPRRFYKMVSVQPVEHGFAIALDGREVRTPARRPLRLPSLALAERLAAEWDAQEKEVRPDAMPFTRLANTAIDRMAGDPSIVAIVRDDHVETGPAPSAVLHVGDRLVTIGTGEAVDKVDRILRGLE